MASYRSPLLDLTTTDEGTVTFLLDYFAAKTTQDPIATLEFFSPEALTYTDAPLGWATKGRDGIRDSFASVMPHWGDALSYPTSVHGSFAGGDGSAVVGFTNTPGIVGQELLHILAAVDVRGGKIVRWVDYWDTASIDPDFRDQVRALSASFPETFSEDQLTAVRHGAVDRASRSLHSAVRADDPREAANLFDYDATWEDLALGVRVTGRPAIARYLERSKEESPLGEGSRLRHVLGRDTDGGFEWHGSPASGVPSGITALTLTSEGVILKATSVYDAKTLAGASRGQLIAMATEPR